jgi:very-short-patch-repair endonuclease
MREGGAAPDFFLARVAARQHGVVTTAQLAAVGIEKSAVSRRVAAGRLHRVYRGVYAVGHTALASEGRWLAAVLACGGGAVLSHRSAAELWELLPSRPGPVDVTVPTANGRTRRPGVRLHRAPSLPVGATTRRNAIAVTTPARTIADLRRVTGTDDQRRALRQAEFLGLDLGDRGGAQSEPTRSGLERRFLGLCRRHRLPAPEVNAPIGPYEVDFLWQAQRLVVETDGYNAHRGRLAFEADRARDAALTLLGYTVVRFTHRQVVDEAPQVGRTLRALLAPS